MQQRHASCVAGHVFLGPRRLYQQLEELQHDLAVVQDVSLLVRRLQGTYQVTVLLVNLSLMTQGVGPDLCGGRLKVTSDPPHMTSVGV